MSSSSDTPGNAEPSAPSLPNSGQIHWAAAPGTVKRFDLQEQLEAAKARNWINDRMIAQCQKHWHCTREEAIERLLAQQH